MAQPLNFATPAPRPGEQPHGMAHHGPRDVFAGLPEWKETTVLEDDDEGKTRKMFDEIRDAAKKENHVFAVGECPAIESREPGLSVTTIDIPSHASKAQWCSFLQVFCQAEGIIVLRPQGSAAWDFDDYLHASKLLEEICEVIEGRPLYIVCVVDGAVRGTQMFWLGISHTVLTVPHATFGFPSGAHGQAAMNPAVWLVLRTRVHEHILDRLQKVGDTIDAYEAQRLGVVDFVGKAEDELARIIFKTCKPKVTTYMFKPDLVRALEEKEAEGEEEEEDEE